MITKQLYIMHSFWSILVFLTKTQSYMMHTAEERVLMVFS